MSTGGLALSPPAVLCAATRGREGTRGIYPPGSLPFPIHGTLVTPVVNAPHFCATWGCVECPVLHPAVGHSTRVSKLSQGDKLWVCSRCVLDRIRFNPQGVSPAARPFSSFSRRGNFLRRSLIGLTKGLPHTFSSPRLLSPAHPTIYKQLWLAVLNLHIYLFIIRPFVLGLHEGTHSAPHPHFWNAQMWLADTKQTQRQSKPDLSWATPPVLGYPTCNSISWRDTQLAVLWETGSIGPQK